MISRANLAALQVTSSLVLLLAHFMVSPAAMPLEYVKLGDHRGDPRFISSPITAGDAYSGPGILAPLDQAKKACFWRLSF